jgi:hypothetical protein
LIPEGRSWLLALLLLPLVPTQARAEDMPPPPPDQGMVKALAQRTAEGLRGTSMTVEAGYVQGTFKATKPGAPGHTEITDNGQVNLLLDFDTQESALWRVPMKEGNFIVGWNFSAVAGAFHANKQLFNSAFDGTGVGTSVNGQYLAVAPSMFMRMGPLYPHSEIYWTFGMGLGAGATRYSGTAQFGSATGPIETVGTNSVRPAWYGTAYWRLDVGHWLVVFNGKYFMIHDPNLTWASYEIYGLNLGYRITF